MNKEFRKYADEVVSGKIVAGHLVKLACRKYLSWLDGERDDIEFREDKAKKVENFINRLKHQTGKGFYNKPFILQDWQKWVVYNMFGFYYRGTDRRVINNAYIQISRKCGKTSLASAIGLYAMIADGEPGAEVDIVAPTRAQSQICLASATEYIGTVNKGGLFTTLRNKIKFPNRKAFMQIMSSDAKFGDGFNSHVGILDEYHAFETNKVADLIVSSMGARTNPMMIYITTAGFNLYGPAKEYRDMCVELLQGLKDDDSVFAAIYELDSQDDWTDSNNWKKAVPSLGVTVSKSYIEKQIRMARNNTSTEVNVKTKNLNMWCQSNEVWITHEDLMENMHKIDLADFEGSPCYYGIDLATRKDLAGFAILFPPNPMREKFPDKFVFTVRAFVPEDNLQTSKNADLYRRMKQGGFLITTPGNVTDYDYILNEMKKCTEQTGFPEYVAYDEFNASQFTINAQEIGYNMEPFSQQLGSFNRPTKEFERLLLSGKVVLDYSPLLLWCFQNVTLKEDPITENIKPIK